jgi:arylformamidase
MRIHDVSMDIQPGMLYWHEGRKPEITQVQSVAAGDAANVSRWLLGSHTGTHVDAPLHFVEGGISIERLDLDSLVGEARVVDCSASDKPICARTVEEARLDGATRVLFKTTNSTTRLQQRDWDFSYVAVTGDGAQALVDHGVKLMGLDYLTVDVAEATRHWPAHHVLCGNGVAILEGIDLSRIEDGTYFMVCLPIKLRGSEAAPARTILIEGMPTS